jgi:hypothetical protein
MTGHKWPSYVGRLKSSWTTLLLRVETSWRCGDGLFFEVLPFASGILLTTLHPLLGNVLQTVDHFEISCLGAPFSWLEKPGNRMGRDLNWILCSAWKKVDWLNPIRTSAIQSRNTIQYNQKSCKIPRILIAGGSKRLFRYPVSSLDTTSQSVHCKQWDTPGGGGNNSIPGCMTPNWEVPEM